MGESNKIAENSGNNNFTKDKHGNCFAKGHQIGRMKKKGYTLLDLTKVAMAYDKKHDDSILKHYIERLQKNDKLLDKFIDRYVPVKTINELTGKDGKPLVFERVIYVEDKGDK